MTIFKNCLLLFAVIFLSKISFAQQIVAFTPEIPQNIIFKNVDDNRMMRMFLEVYHGFEDIDDIDIVLIEKKFKSSTMQAQPKISLQTFFGKRKQYKININKFVITTESRVAELPEAVLKGWFAHEIGHIIDYHSRSNMRMAFFGIKYLLSKRFKKQVEHDADVIAVNYGFSDYIIAMKRYILESDYVANHYKSKIQQFYMTIEDIDLLLEENVTQEAPSRGLLD